MNSIVKPVILKAPKEGTVEYFVRNLTIENRQKVSIVLSEHLPIFQQIAEEKSKNIRNKIVKVLCSGEDVPSPFSIIEDIKSFDFNALKVELGKYNSKTGKIKPFNVY